GDERSVSKWWITVSRRLGEKYLKAGCYAEARDCAQEAIALGSEGWQSHLLLGKAQWRLGASEEAYGSVKRAAELNREEPSVRKWWIGVSRRLGEEYLKAGHYAEARDCAKEAIGFGSEGWQSHLLLGEAQWRLGAFEEAYGSVKRAAELNREEPSVRKWWISVSRRLGEEYLKAGHYAEARDCAQEAIALGSEG